jgi:hypothetical protein
MDNVTKALRAAVERDGRSLPALAAASGLDRCQLWRFMTSRRDLRVASADALCLALGVECRLVRRRRG